MKIEIYGEEYKVKFKQKDDNFDSCCGYCDIVDHKIVIDKRNEEKHSLEGWKKFLRRTLIHELVHAVAYESGVEYDHNENLTEWIAKAYLAIEKVMPEIDKKLEKLTG